MNIGIFEIISGALKGIREAQEDAAERKRQADIEEIKMQKQANLQAAAKCDEELEKLEKAGEKSCVIEVSLEDQRMNPESLELNDDTESEDETPKKPKKKSSKSRRRIISEDEEEDDDQVLALSMPTTKKRRKKQQVAANPRESKERKRFTEVEDGAIYEGVREYGVGQWAQIKAFRPVELADRTTINLKDRWRTLNR